MIGRKFKFQAQDSFLEYFFWRFGDLKKRIALSEKKTPLAQKQIIVVIVWFLPVLLTPLAPLGALKYLVEI